MEWLVLHLMSGPAGIVLGHDTTGFDERECSSCFPFHNATHLLNVRIIRTKSDYIIENGGNHFEHLPWNIEKFVSLYLIVLLYIKITSIEMLIFSLCSTADPPLLTENSLANMIWRNYNNQNWKFANISETGGVRVRQPLFDLKRN